MEYVLVLECACEVPHQAIVRGRGEHFEILKIISGTEKGLRTGICPVCGKALTGREYRVSDLYKTGVWK